MNIFKEFHYKEVSDTLREITSGPYKGCTLSNKSTLYSPDNHPIKAFSSELHPTKYINYRNTGITVWRLMCYVWLDDLSEYLVTSLEEEFISNYRITYRFWQKYNYLANKVFKTNSDYIPLPTDVAFNIKSGKIVKMKPKTKALFNLGDLSILTVVADFKALMSNKSIEEHKNNTVKIDNVVELATRYKKLSEANKALSEQIATLTTQQNELVKEMNAIKVNLTSILK